MKISVIGTINKDLILPFNDVPIESFGGVFYPTSILSRLMGEDDRVIPVSYVGDDVRVNLEAVLGRLPNVSTRGLIGTEEKNHKVILEYTSPEERTEKSLFAFPPMTYQQIAPYADADMIIVNLISGWDVEPEAFFKLADACGDRLYVDIHYLLMGVDNLGRRFQRRPEGVEEWVRAPRFVQMNEREFSIIAGEIRNEVAFFQKYCRPEQTLIITRAGAGATVIYSRNGMTAKKEFSAYVIPRLVDSTGCGDSFGAAFCVNYLKTGDIAKSVQFAHLVAAANASLRGTNEMYKLKETMEAIESSAKVSV